jgi:hypothetical protein
MSLSLSSSNSLSATSQFETFQKGDILASDGGSYARLESPLINGYSLVVDSTKRQGVKWSALAGTGENNTLVSVTSGGESINSTKLGVALRTKGVKAGVGISVISDSTDLTISSTTQPGLFFQGVWNGTTNVPTLTNTPQVSGNYYICSVAGSTILNGINDWGINDWVVSNGTVWQKIDNSEIPINDAITTTNTLWSSSKISTELSGKAPLIHTHSYSDVLENSTNNTPISLRTQSNKNFSSGWESGGVVSVNGINVNVSAGSGYVRINASETSDLVFTTWNALVGLPMVDNVVNYVYANFSGSLNAFVTTTTALENETTSILLATVFRSSTSLTISNNVKRHSVNSAMKTQQRMLQLNSIEYQSGSNLVYDNLNLRFSVGTGYWWRSLNQMTVNAFVLGSSFTYYTRNVSLVFVPSTVTVFQNLTFDNNGTQTTLAGGKYGVHFVYLFESGAVALVSGQASYNDTNSARSASPPTILPPLLYHAWYLARITFEKSKVDQNAGEIFIDMSFSKSTSSGGGGGAVLSLATLTDVTLTTPTNNQLLQYSTGTSKWINATVAVGEANTSSSAGGTASLVLAKVGVNLPFKGLTAGTNVTLTNNANDVVINSTGEVNTASSVGGTVSLVNAKVGVNLPFKGLTAGTNITLTNNTNDVVINSTGGAATTISIDPACPFLSAFLVGSNYTLSTRAHETIRIGLNAGGVSGTQNAFGISFGDNSGKTSGVENLAIGPSSMGGTSQTKNSATAIGILSGYTNLGTRATVIGFSTGFTGSGDDSVAIGSYAATSATAPFTVSIGNRANFSAPNVNCIVINATTTALNGLNTTPGCFINPIAGKNQSPESLYYNNSTKELTYERAGQLPRFTTAQRLALTGLQPGFLCYDTDLLQLGLWSGITWRMI